jgi:hypothetical protein
MAFKNHHQILRVDRLQETEEFCTLMSTHPWSHSVLLGLAWEDFLHLPFDPELRVHDRCHCCILCLSGSQQWAIVTKMITKNTTAATQAIPQLRIKKFSELVCETHCFQELMERSRWHNQEIALLSTSNCC